MLGTGHRLSKAGVSVDPRKVQSIVEWATPTSCSEVRRFTVLANYYRRFVEPTVEGYSELAGLLAAISARLRGSRGPRRRKRASTH